MSSFLNLDGIKNIITKLKGKLDKKIEFSEYNKVNQGDMDVSLINSRFLNTGKWDMIKFPSIGDKHNYIALMGLNNNRSLLTCNNEYVVKGSGYSGGYQLFMGDITNLGNYSVALGTAGLKNGNMTPVGGSLIFETANNVSKISVSGALLNTSEIFTGTIKHSGTLKIGRFSNTNDRYLEVGFYGIKSSGTPDYNSVYSTNGQQTKKSIQTFMVDISGTPYDKNKFYKLQAPNNYNMLYGELVIYKINPKWRGYSKAEGLANISDKINLSGKDSNTIIGTGILHFKYINGETGLQKVKLEFSSQSKEQAEDQIWAIHSAGDTKEVFIRGGGKYYLALTNYFITENKIINPNTKWNEIFIDSQNPISYDKDLIF